MGKKEILIRVFMGLGMVGGGVMGVDCAPQTTAQVRPNESPTPRDYLDFPKPTPALKEQDFIPEIKKGYEPTSAPESTSTSTAVRPTEKPVVITPTETPKPPSTPKPTETVTPRPTQEEKGSQEIKDPPQFHKGFSVLMYGNNSEVAQRSEELLNRLVADGANIVSLVFPLFQDNSTATEVYPDRSGLNRTPTKETMRIFIQTAHNLGLGVMLRPILDEENIAKDGKWRGNIEPKDRAAWFNSYGALIKDYALFAQEQKVEVLSLGVELISLENEIPRWQSLNDEVKAIYQGKTAYAGNWSPLNEEMAQIVDLYGIDAFFPLAAESGATVEQLMEAWQPWMEKIDRFNQTIGKKVIFMEVGTTSQTGSFQTPYVWNHQSGLNYQDQANYFAATCRIVKNDTAGMYPWGVDFNQNPKTIIDDESFNPLGKPAEQVIKDCYS